MKKKMLAGVLAVLLGLAEASFPVAAQSTVSEENISSAEIREAYSAEKPVNAEMQTEDPKKAILAQDAAMEQQEDLEDEENMPAREPDPLVLDDDGSVVPASVAAWTDEDAEPETETEPAEKTGIQDPGEVRHRNRKKRFFSMEIQTGRWKRPVRQRMKCRLLTRQRMKMNRLIHWKKYRKPQIQRQQELPVKNWNRSLSRSVYRETHRAQLMQKQLKFPVKN